MKLYLPLSFLVVAACAPTGQQIYKEPRRMVVQAPVVNVRAEPQFHSGEYKFDPLQETQLERGEPVLVLERAGDWVRVAAPEQLEFSHNNKWEGYPGWVPIKSLSKDLALHHRLQKEIGPSDKLREKILKQAAQHIGNPYLWGGRSLHQPQIKDVATGVDCSGLVNWSYRQLGWFIPRDAHEQFLKSRRIESAELKPGDLIFLAKTTKPEKMVHVMFYEKEGMLLEAPQSGEKVRRISVQDRFGTDLKKVKSGDTVGNRVVYFGSFFPEVE